ncbi:MAG: hypothetical protein ABI718_00190 [Acidobacteriota bacterium]
MPGTAPPVLELSGSSIVQRVVEGSLPREFVIYAAKGLLPLPQDDVVAVLAFLAGGDDEEIVTTARQTLNELPAKIVLAYARSELAESVGLDRLAFAASDPAIIEAVLRNRITADETVASLARTVTPYLQEVIVINEERIIRHPDILEALLRNPQLSSHIRRRALEVREEFFEKKARLEAIRQEVEEELDELSDEDKQQIADLLERATAESVDGEEPAAIPMEGVAPDNLPVFNRILAMSVAQRIKCAYKGGRPERNILVRDRNKLVSSAVLRNGRCSDSEIEGFAQLRNVDDEVLRVIATNRTWTSKYPIVLALVRNSKTPIGVALPLVNRLTLKDLRFLAKDRNVSDTIRKTAARVGELRARH